MKVLTQQGFVGRGGGRWSRVPAPEMWYGASIQVCGIYPFGTGTARPVSGAPLGRDMQSGTAVAMDHHSLYQEGVISSPSMFLWGINGVGKSSTAQTMTLGMMGRGMVPAVFNPLKKGEHTPLVERSGGAVFEFGPTTRHQLNLLSLGPLGRAAARIGGKTGEELRELAVWKIIQQAQLALRVSRGSNLTDIEDLVVDSLVHDILSRQRRPVTRDLETAFTSPTEQVLTRTGQRSVEAFHARFEGLGESIRAMLGGDIGRLLGGTESVEIDPGNRGGFCFDTSSIPDSAPKLLSTAMLMSWSLGMDAIDAHWEIAKYEAEMAQAAAEVGDVYVPEVVWTGYTTLMDEFWYPIRSTPGIVDRADQLSRSNRSKGTAEMKITHSPKDMLSLPDAHDREKARGLAERSGLLGLMSLTRADLEELSAVKPLTDREIDEVVRYNGSSSWGRPPQAGAERAEQAPPPGAGKVLFKVEGRPGISVQMVQTDVQKSLHITDQRFREQRRGTVTRRSI
ncbi:MULTISPECIES: hypothetical protein [Bacteria]|uniref:hypothetical protein n=1 Tax=Bacteria TaxID=2 RepID=UPI003C7EABEB